MKPKKDPILVSDGGGSSSTELYASGASDLSLQEEGQADTDNNNNAKDNPNTQTSNSEERTPGDAQNSSGSSGTRVHSSSPGCHIARHSRLPQRDTRQPNSAGVPNGDATQRDPRSAAVPPFTTSSNDEGVRGVYTSTPQPPPEKGKLNSESEMETDLSEGETKDSMSEDNSDAWQESKEDTVTRASAIVSDWSAQILDGLEVVLKLPREDPALTLVREIAEQANFSLTERPS